MYVGKKKNNQKQTHPLTHLKIEKEEINEQQLFAGFNFVITGSVVQFANRN